MCISVAVHDQEEGGALTGPRKEGGGQGGGGGGGVTGPKTTKPAVNVAPLGERGVRQRDRTRPGTALNGATKSCK